MARPYKLLRDLMHQHEITSAILGRELKISPSTISRKLNGHAAWDSDEMWQIMTIVQEPAYRLHEIFPRDGKNEIRKGV